MKWLTLTTAVLALLAPAVHAQSTGDAATPFMEAPGSYLVFFPLDKAELNSDDRRIVTQAAEEYRETGRARIEVTGHTDSSGSAEYNLRLSERRAQVVADELIRQGVPAADLAVMGRGEEDLRTPTADNVVEADNRRVEVVFDVAEPEPEPAPAAAAPAPAAPAAAPEPTEVEESSPFLGLRMSALYGHNFAEQDGAAGSDKTQNDLAGVELSFDALPGNLVGLSLRQAVLYSFNGEDDGFNGRSGVSLGLTPLNLGIINPYLSANGGYIYGSGVQDGFVAGPELGFNIPAGESVVLNAKVAYDYQFRNPNWDEGIVWGGVSLGFLF